MMRADRRKTELTFCASKRQTHRSFRSRFGSLGALVLLSAGLWRALALAFASLEGVWLVGLGVQLGMALLLLPLCNGRWDALTLPMALAVTAAVCVFFWAPIRAALALPMNELLAFLTQTTGRIYADCHVATAGVPVWAVIGPALLGGALLGWAAWRGVFWPAMPFALLFAAGCAVGLFAPDWGWGLVLGGALWLRMRCVCRGGTKSAFWAQAVALTLALAAAFGVGQLVPQRSDAALEQTLDRVHALLWDEPTNSMPEGKLAGLGAWAKSDAPALAVTMDEPQRLYLRGRVYDSYTGTCWEMADAGQRAEYEALFYLLHRRDFYAQEQMAAAMMQTETFEPQRLTVENLSACRRVAYLPYALYDCDALDARSIGDAGARGGTVQSFLYLPGDVPQWYEVQKTLQSGQWDEQTAAYLAAAQEYRGYAERFDTQITQSAWSTLDQKLHAGKKGRSLEQICALIRAYLGENLRYDEQCVAPQEGDFLSWLLDESGCGYSVHYATAATLMLRYYGVPARYVEGYVLTGEQAEGLAAGERVVLTEENAHAWAEYYLEDVGFVPFEVTPGYIGQEEPAMTSSGGTVGYEADAMTYERIQPPQPQTEEQTPAPPMPEPEQTEPESAFRAVWLLWLLMLPVAAGLGFVLWRRMQLRRALRRIERARPRKAIALRYDHARALMERLDEEPENAREAAELYAQARFSCHEMTQEQRQWMDEFARSVLRQGKETWPPMRKLRYRLIDGLY